jgi:hypothetical protein
MKTFCPTAGTPNGAAYIFVMSLIPALAPHFPSSSGLPACAGWIS